METLEGTSEISGKFGGTPEILGGQQKGQWGRRDVRGDTQYFRGDTQRDATADTEGTALGTPIAEKGRGRDADRRGTSGGTRARPGDTRRDAAGSKGTLSGTFRPPEGHFRGLSMALALSPMVS